MFAERSRYAAIVQIIKVSNMFRLKIPERLSVPVLGHKGVLSS